MMSSFYGDRTALSPADEPNGWAQLLEQKNHPVERARSPSLDSMLSLPWDQDGDTVLASTDPSEARSLTSDSCSESIWPSTDGIVTEALVPARSHDGGLTEAVKSPTGDCVRQKREPSGEGRKETRAQKSTRS